MKKRALIGILMTVAAVSSYYAFKQHQPSASPAADFVWVKAVNVEEKSLPKEVRSIGTLTARNVEITPELAGHVVKMGFIDGASVKAGNTLIQIDDVIYRAKHTSAQARFKLSELNHARMMTLSKKGVISKQAIDQAEADLKERKAEVSETESMLSKTKLLAPFSGVVGKSNVGVGDFVNSGQKLVTLTDIKHLRIEYNLPEKQLASLKTGQQVTVVTASYPEEKFIGTVSFISPTIDTTSRTVSVYADLKNDRQLLASGMFVDVSQSLGVDEKVLVIPERSLIPMLDGQQVYKVVDGKAYAAAVTIGKRYNGSVQILSGLSHNDIVITDGQMKVKTGTPVKLKT